MMFKIDPIGLFNLIRQSLREEIRNTLVNFVADQARNLASDEISSWIKKLRSDPGVQKTFEKGCSRLSRASLKSTRGRVATFIAAELEQIMRSEEEEEDDTKQE